MKENNPEKGITRRRFIKTAAAALGAALLPETLRGENTENKSEKKHKFSWENIYRNPDKVKVVPDKKFNDNFEKAEKVFRQLSFAVSPGGERLFFSDYKENAIHIFGEDGKFIKSFGQKGEGPGDLNYSHIDGIFNDRLVVSTNYGLKTQISYFNLNGKHFLEKEKYINKKIIGLSFVGENIVFLDRFIKQEDGNGIEEKTFNIKKGKKEAVPIFVNKTKMDIVFKEEKPFFRVNVDFLCNLGNFMLSGPDFSFFGRTDKSSAYFVFKDGSVREIPIFSEKEKTTFSSKKIKEIKEKYFKEIESFEDNQLSPPDKKLIKNDAGRFIEKKEGATAPYFDNIAVDETGNIIFSNKEKNKVFVYKLSADKKNVIKIAEFSDKTELGKRISLLKLLNLSGGSIYGFSENENGDTFFQKFDLNLSEK